MSSDTLEPAVAHGSAAGPLTTRPLAPEQATAPFPSSLRPGPPLRGPLPLLLARGLARLRADTALGQCLHMLVLSRALVWIVGAGVLLVFGWGPARGAFDPPGVTRGFGALGDLLAGPAARWDSAWYLVIAHHGYRPDLGRFTAPRDAFFPLYPLGIRALGGLGLAPLLAGVGISLGALTAALYGIHRLASLELGGETARAAVTLTAFAPMAFFFSAVYTESLYLALSVGLFWFARRGRWGWVGVLGAFAAATRNTGVVLLVPALLLYLYGPRADRPPDRLRAGTSAWWRRLRPRYRVRGEALWLALIPLGAGAYLAYLGLAGGDPLAPFHEQGVWHRHFAAPFAGVWQGVGAGFDGARQLLSGQGHRLYFAPTQGNPTIAAAHNLVELGFLALAAALLIGACRRLPVAYGAYVLAALALPLSSPVPSQPLMSLPRFLLVLFPLTFAAAAWLAPRPRALRAALVVCALLMGVFVAQFSTWHWVA